MAASTARIVSLPARHEGRGTVDDWGRDAGFVRVAATLARFRWTVTVGGDQRLPRRGGALIVVNTRPLALSTIWSALAIGEAVDRPVRYVGRPDTAPLGAWARRLGGMLDHPDEVGGALTAGELVLVGAGSADGGSTVGDIDHAIVGTALAGRVPVHPCAIASSPVARAARVEIGSAATQPRRRRGPLAELELADRVRDDLVVLLDGFGR